MSHADNRPTVAGLCKRNLSNAIKIIASHAVGMTQTASKGLRIQPILTNQRHHLPSRYSPVADRILMCCIQLRHRFSE